MGKSTPSPPPAPQAPDPVAAARAQGAANAETAVTQAYLNNVNQATPYGTLKYDVTDHQQVGSNNVPIFTASQDLTPAGQKLLDTNMATTQGTADLAKAYTSRIGEATANPYSYSGLPGAPTYNEDYRKQQLSAIEQRNQPQMDRDRAALEQRLADQGVGLQDPAYRSAMDQYQRGVNDFRLGADVQAGNAASQQYGLEANTRDRAIQEMTNLRSQPINEVAALLGTGTGVQNPNFVNTPQTQVAPTDTYAPYALQQQAYGNQLQAYNTQMQGQNATTGGLFGLGGTALAAGAKYGLPLLMAGSDIRMKENVRHVGHTTDGQKLYFFTYKGDPNTPHVGLMAQDVEKVRPDAVVEIDGMKYVDYGKALADA